MAHSNSIVPMTHLGKAWDRPLGHGAIRRRPNVPMSQCPVAATRASVRDVRACDASACMRKRACVHGSFFFLGHWDNRTKDRVALIEGGKACQ